MADTGRRSSSQPRRRRRVELALGEINTLIVSYERRVRVNPDDSIAGSSRIVLQHLLAEVQQYLPRGGAISKAIDERLIGPDEANTAFQPRVADELDLLLLIKHEFGRQVDDSGASNSRSVQPPRGNPPQTKWGGGPGDGEPHRNRRKPQPPAQETERRGYTAFPLGSIAPKWSDSSDVMF
jgi:hypothetical protein